MISVGRAQTENPCVAGSIPALATSKHQGLRVLRRLDDISDNSDDRRNASQPRSLRMTVPLHFTPNFPQR